MHRMRESVAEAELILVVGGCWVRVVDWLGGGGGGEGEGKVVWWGGGWGGGLENFYGKGWGGGVSKVGREGEREGDGCVVSMVGGEAKRREGAASLRRGTNVFHGTQ